MRNFHITPSITHSSAVVEIYFADISKARMCTAEEEIDLAKRIRSGDRQALEKLTSSNLRFVVSIAKKYQFQGLALSDLISEGNLGLIKAAYRFDETRGFKFISFAVWWIRQSIIAAITENARMIRLPVNNIHEITKINKAVNAIEQQHQSPPSTEQVAEYLQMDAGKISRALQDAKWTSSLDIVHDGEELSLLDKIYSPDDRADACFINDDRILELRNLLHKLPDRERKLIELSYGLNGLYPMVPAEIGPILGLSTERVRQLKIVALNILENSSNSMFRNLIPCCENCNRIKGDYWRKNGYRRILHFYNDTFIQYRFLYAKIIHHRGISTPRFSFFLKKPAAITAGEFKIIKGHFKQFNLLTKYNEKANALITSQISILKDGRADGRDKASLITELRRTYNNLALDFGVNYWEGIISETIANTHKIINSL
nr:RNA polymerase sigma factor RpoD/SigA [Mucilaginibacter aquariorum]